MKKNQLMELLKVNANKIIFRSKYIAKHLLKLVKSIFLNL